MGSVEFDTREYLERQARAEMAYDESLEPRAREELIEALMEGKSVGLCDFTDLLDCEIDRMPAALRDLGGMLLTIIAYAKDDYTHVERRERLQRWMRDICERYVDANPELIQERAAELSNDGEDL